MGDHDKSPDYYDNGPFGVVRYGRDEMVQHEHPLADGSDDVEPGMLVERVEESGETRVQPHSTSGDMANAYVAIEARGRGMDALDGAYAEDEDNVVRYVKASGGGLNLLLADDEDASLGDSLTSNGDGYLKVYASADDDNAGFEAAASVDNTGAGNARFVPSEVTR